jgi:hypothetical protein
MRRMWEVPAKTRIVQMEDIMTKDRLEFIRPTALWEKVEKDSMRTTSFHAHHHDHDHARHHGRTKGSLHPPHLIGSIPISKTLSHLICLSDLHKKRGSIIQRDQRNGQVDHREARPGKTQVSSWTKVDSGTEPDIYTLPLQIT